MNMPRRFRRHDIQNNGQNRTEKVFLDVLALQLTTSLQSLRRDRSLIVDHLGG